MKMVDPVSELEKEQKNRLQQKIIGDGSPDEIQKLARVCNLLRSLEPYSPGPNRSGVELEQELKHYVFTAVLMLQRVPGQKRFERWQIEDIAQKLRAQEERRSRGESIAKDVSDLKKDEKKFLDEEVNRLAKEGKLEFTPRLWREICVKDRAGNHRVAARDPQR